MRNSGSDRSATPEIETTRKSGRRFLRRGNQPPVVVLVVAADHFQQDDLVAGQIDGFLPDLLVGDVVHRQAQRAAERLQDLEDAAMQADKGNRGGRLGRRWNGFGGEERGRSKRAYIARASRARRTCAERPYEQTYSTLNVSNVFAPAATWTFHFVCFGSL